MHELSFLEAIFPELHGPFVDCTCSNQGLQYEKNRHSVECSPRSYGRRPCPNRAASQTTKPAPATTQIMKVDDVRPGMRALAIRFPGTKPETMGVEVLGVLHNMNGPKVTWSGEAAGQ
jgi:hypothetical protein